VNSESLIAFLNARLDEDEAAARTATDGSWYREGSEVRGHSRAYAGGEPGIVVIKWTWPQEADHIIRHDPARVLREVEAKRVIMEWHYRGLPPEGAPEGLEICAGEEGDGDTWQMATPWPCPQIRALAAVYSDHPDYREEWAARRPKGES
jgi:Family of unknown function (DUF6221)